jgi:hypothetical protein
MATAEDDFRAALLSESSLLALVADARSVAQNMVEEETPLPYVVFSAVHSPVRGLDGAQMADQVTITAECWADSAAEADALADAVDTALRNFSPPLAGATIVSRASGFDEETRLHETVLLLDWWTD